MDLHASHPFSEAFEIASGATGERFQNPLWKLTEALWGACVRKSLNEVHQFGECIVDRTSQRHGHPRGASAVGAVSLDLSNDDLETSAKTLAGKRRPNLIDALTAELNSPKEVADAALNFLSAGQSPQLTRTIQMLTH